jgi:hypothetical protein
MALVIEIPKKATKKQIDSLLKKATNNKQSKMAKHFGALKRGFDGSELQKKLRNDWN